MDIEDFVDSAESFLKKSLVLLADFLTSLLSDYRPSIYLATIFLKYRLQGSRRT